MKKTIRKSLAFLLAVTVILSMGCFPAIAADESETEEIPSQEVVLEKNPEEEVVLEENPEEVDEAPIAPVEETEEPPAEEEDSSKAPCEECGSTVGLDGVLQHESGCSQAAEEGKEEAEPDLEVEADKTACSVTEGCTLPNGHEGDCDVFESVPFVHVEDCPETDLPESLHQSEQDCRQAILDMERIALFSDVLPVSDGRYTLTNTQEVAVKYQAGALTVNGESIPAGTSIVVNTTSTVSKKNITVESDDSSVVIPIELDGVQIRMEDILNSPAMDIGQGAQVKLTVSNENTLRASGPHGGINLQNGAGLEIVGTGSLTARGGHGTATSTSMGSMTTGNGGPGIGCSSDLGAVSFSVTIHCSGSITAIGDSGGAGIGSGAGSCGGDIVIESGTITAIGTGSASPGAWDGDSGGSGIGGGYEGRVDHIKINNGKIVATAGGHSDAIGGGYEKGASGETGIGWADIEINGGNLNLTGGQNSGCALYGNLSIADGVSIEAVALGSDSKYPAIYNKGEAPIVAALLNVILEEREAPDKELQVTISNKANPGDEAVLTLPTKYRAFAKTVASSAAYEIKTENRQLAVKETPQSSLFTSGAEAVTAVTYINEAALLDVVYLKDAGDDAKDGSSSENALKTWKKAYEVLRPGGTIVVCGPLKMVDQGYGENLDILNKQATITSKFDGRDYRTEAGATITGSNAYVYLHESTVFENVAFEMGNARFYAGGYNLTFGDGITSKAINIQGGDYYFSVYGGRNSEITGSPRITIRSGDYQSIYAGGYYNKVIGSPEIRLLGGTIQYATGKDVSGKKVLYIDGGTENSPVDIYNLWTYDRIQIGQEGTPAYLRLFNTDSAAIDDGSVADLEIAPGSTLEVVASDMDKCLTGNFIGGGTLILPAGKGLVVPGKVSGTTTLKITGTPTPGIYVQAQKDGSSGDFTLDGMPGWKLSRVEDNGNYLWVLSREGSAPVYTSSTKAVAAVYGEEVVLSAPAAGATSYQWQATSDNGTTWQDLEGETDSKLSRSGLVVGTYQYRCIAKNTGGEADQTQTLTISPATLVVRVLSYVVAKNEPIPDLEYTVTGLVGSDQLSAQPSLTIQKNGVAASTPLAEGTYDIVAADTDAGTNYTVQETNGRLVVTAAAIAVEAVVEDQSRQVTADAAIAPDAVDLTEDAEKQNVTKIEVQLVVRDADLGEPDIAEDVHLVEEAIPPKTKLSAPLNILVMKQVTENGTAGQLEVVPSEEIQKPIKIVFELSEELRGKEDYRVVRVHEGKTEFLPTELQGNQLVFYSDLFSTYLISYAEPDKDPNVPSDSESEEPSGGSSGGSSAVPVVTPSVPSGGGSTEPSRGSSTGSSAKGAEEFWDSVVTRLKKASDGDVVNIKVGNAEHVPVRVLKALAGRDITLVISHGGRETILNGLELQELPENKVFYTFDDLDELCTGRAVDAATGDAPQASETPAVPEAGPKPPEIDEEAGVSTLSGAPAWALLAVVCALLAIFAGIIFHYRKKQNK